MELGTTSAVITFAIELDTKSQTYYAKVQETSTDTKLLEVLQVMQKRQTRRNKRLQRFRRELVTEMILEPIHGFNREDYDLDIDITTDLETAKIVTALVSNEENMRDYLMMASEKIDFLPELSDQFQLLAEDVESNIQALKELQ